MDHRSLKVLREEAVRRVRSTIFVGLKFAEPFVQEFGLSQEKMPSHSVEIPGVESSSKFECLLIENFDAHGDDVSNRSIIEKLSSGRFDAICSFWPEEWHRDLSKIGISNYCVDHQLFCTLDSKIHQLDLIAKFGSDDISKNISERRQRLHTKYMLLRPSLFFELRKNFDLFVLASATSAGGSGMFLVRNFADFLSVISRISTPIVRTEKFEPAISLTQLGIAFRDDCLVYPAQVQYIRLNNRNLAYAGASSDFGKLGLSNIAQRAAKLTRAVGEAISKLGYVGAFGCDHVYLPDDDKLLFMEINPRFVGETFFFSELAAAANDVLPDLADRILLDPHVLHVCAHALGYCPPILSSLLGSSRVLPVSTSTKEGFVSLAILGGRDSISSYVRPANSIPRMCGLFKETVASEPLVPTQFLAPIEELMTKVPAPTQPAQEF